jgi:carboxyl-terminal processing protease
MIRRAPLALLVNLALVAACGAHQTPSPPIETQHVDARTFASPQLLADFDQLWDFIGDHYCFFDEKKIVWRRVRERYRPLVEGMTDGVAFVGVIEKAIDELYDLHTHLKFHLDGGNRLPGQDLWAEWREGRAIVVEVRRPSEAWDAGLRAGWEVLAIDGVPIAEATRARRPSALSAEDREAAGWALLAVLSGRHGAARALSVRAADGATHSISIPAAASTKDDEPLTFRMLDDNRGYIAIRSFAQPDLVERFDRALDALRTTRGLVIDVRNNGGGNTALARPIMGRFIQTRKQYAWMSRRAGGQMAPRWPEFVEPRGPWTYTQPVVVLVNHWSASMAEGFPMGMHGIGRATIVGTPMMGLGAGVIDAVLGWTQLPLQVSAEPVFHVDGTPRWRLRPDVLVDLAQPSADDDPIVAAGLRVLAGGARAPER